MKCCSCGEEIRENSHFCTACGAKQPEVAAEPVAEPVMEPMAEPAAEPVVEPVAQPEPKYEFVPQPVQAPVQQPVYQAPIFNTPRYQLPDRRGLAKMFFLGLLTGGIYNMVIMSRIAEEMNMVASKYDGQRTQQYYWALVLTGLTMGVYAFVWIHGLCNRMGSELKRRGINYKFNASTFWLWNILGSLLFGIGPLVYCFKLCKASNLINRDYNING